MAAVFRVLERDGFSPEGATSEEMMVHLCRINEKTKENLQKEKVSSLENNNIDACVGVKLRC